MKAVPRTCPASRGHRNVRKRETSNMSHVLNPAKGYARVRNGSVTRAARVRALECPFRTIAMSAQMNHV